jgi:hypothetical protein
LAFAGTVFTDTTSIGASGLGATFGSCGFVADAAAGAGAPAGKPCACVSSFFYCCFDGSG